jgi:hypothetical protein
MSKIEIARDLSPYFLLLLLLGSCAEVQPVAEVDFEKVPEGEARQIEEIAAITPELQNDRTANQYGDALRGVHPKAHGCVEASLIVKEGLDEIYKVGFLATPGRFNASVRFSNASVKLAADLEDGKHGSRGMAIKVSDLEGEFIGSESDQDFLMINTPEFAFANVRSYTFLTRALAESEYGNEAQSLFALVVALAKAKQSSPPFPEPMEQDLGLLRGIAAASDQVAIPDGFTLQDLKELTATLNIVVTKIEQLPVSNPLQVSYFGAAPYLFGTERAMKFSVVPQLSDILVSDIPENPGGDYLAEALVRSMKTSGLIIFDFKILVRTDDEFSDSKVLIENASTTWDTLQASEVDSYTSVATLEIKAPQEISTAVAREECEEMAFSPWNSLVDHKNSAKFRKAQSLRHLDQGWDADERKRFYHHDQGSRLIEFSLFRNLELADSKKLISDGQNIERYQYLLDVKHPEHNPYGLPVGFTVSDADQTGNRWVGLTCAACHTSDIHYKGTRLRVDGAPAMSHFQNFITDLSDAAAQAADVDSERYRSLLTRVSKDQELSVSEKEENVLRQGLLESSTRLTALEKATKKNNNNTGGYGTLDAFGEIMNAVTGRGMGVSGNVQPPQNPVSYPFLWNTPQLDRVQWNGVGSDVMTRNLGEVLGVFGQFVVSDQANPGRSLTSSANIKSLHQLESWVNDLKAPRWDTSVFGKLDDERKILEGKRLFSQQCKGCHAVRDVNGYFPRTDPNSLGKSFVPVKLIPAASVGTDKHMAMDFINRITITNSGPKPTACVLGGLVNNFKKRAYFGLNLSENERHKFNGYRINPFPPNFTPEQKCEATLRMLNAGKAGPLEGAYKAGPLEGIWATAPYLHNGSVRTLWQLLVPPDKREKSFYVGNREFDPVEVGFLDAPNADGAVFDTHVRGNSNTGHTWGTTLDDEEKRDLIEYMKSL